MDEKKRIALGILPGSGTLILWHKMAAKGSNFMVKTQSSTANLQFRTFSAKRSDRPKGV